MRKWIVLFAVIAASLFGLAALAQESGAINIAFIFDASGSMMAAMEGRTRLAVAQDAFSGMIEALPPEANTSLWVYGHRLSQDDPAASCQDIEEVIPLAPLDKGQFEAAVRGIHAIGYTPITTSLQLAAQTLVGQPNARNTIVLVSDGEETCGGSPCLMAQALKQANIDLTVNTIGFAPDDVTREQLQCIAEVTGGTYYDAPDAAQLGEALEAAVAPPGTVQLVDENGNELTNASFQVFDLDSGALISDFTGSAVLAAGDYRVTVAGEPPVDTTVTVTPDQVTPLVVTLPTASGIQMVDLNGEPLPDMNFSIVDPATGDWLNGGTGTLAIEPGDYHIVVNTAFPQPFDVTVVDAALTPVQVDPAQGVVRIVDLAGNPLPEMYFNVTDPVSGEVHYGQGEMAVPPGTYPVGVNTAFATAVEATVADGQTVDVPVDPAFGTIVLTDLSGAPLDTMNFNVSAPDGEPVYAQGELNVPPGTYTLRVGVQPPMEVEITVTDGQRLEVPVNNEAGVIRLVDRAGQPLTGMGFNVIEPSTGNETYANGQISLPPGEYTVRADVVFPTETTATVIAGQTTDVTVDAPTGTVQLVDEQGQPLPDLALELFREDGQSTYGYGPIAVPPGDYHAQVQTGFSYETDISVAGGETVNVTVPATGTLQLVDQDGNPLDELLYTVTSQETGEAHSATGPSNLPPGAYDVLVFTVFQYVTSVEIALGQTTGLTVNTAAGTIQIVDEDGNALPDQLFTATRQDTGESAAATGLNVLPPGSYDVEVFTVFSFTTEVEVVDGETSEVEVDTRTGTIQMANGRGNAQPDTLFTVTRLEDGATASATGAIEVPPGEYSVEVLIGKPFTIEVEVVDGETTVVDTVNSTTDHPLE